MPMFLYRRGNGNEGNWPRFIVELRDNDCAYSALHALVANDHIPRKRVRRAIMNEAEVDGEPEFCLNLTLYEGPNGEQAFGAAFLTAELESIDADDLGEREVFKLRDVLDNAAYTFYLKRRKAARGY